jgi:GNAT superfamily N-acetyltransferase
MWLDILGVYNKYQKKGYGKILIEFGESVMLKMGITECRIYTNVKFEETIAIYKHLGYEVYDRKIEHGYDRVFLRKTLLNK